MQPTYCDKNAYTFSQANIAAINKWAQLRHNGRVGSRLNPTTFEFDRSAAALHGLVWYVCIVHVRGMC